MERFINLAIKSKIYLWDIEKKEKNKAEMKISIRGFHRIRKAAYRTKTRVRIKEKRGLPPYLHKRRKRKAFLFGIAVFIAAVILLTSFIWSVEIEGAEKIEKNSIRDALRSCGIGVGVVKYNHDKRVIQREMMKKVPGLSWIWVDIKGTRAIVTVKERTGKPEIKSDDPCNIVASCDGVITRMIVRDGQKMVQEGDVVSKGQLLVSGVMEGAELQLRHADGEIYATTWHEKNGSFPLSKTESLKTGRVYKKHSVAVGGFSIPVYHFKRSPYKDADVSEKEYSLHLWGDLYLPLRLKTEVFEETNILKYDLTPQEAALYYSGELFAELEDGLSDGTKILDRDMQYVKTENGIDLKCMLTCSENISETREIEITE